MSIENPTRQGQEIVIALEWRTQTWFPLVINYCEANFEPTNHPTTYFTMYSATKSTNYTRNSTWWYVHSPELLQTLKRF